MKYFASLLLVLTILASCGKGNESEKLNAVTGMDLFDINGQAIGRWHIPNHNRGDNFVYPNPSGGEMFLASREDLNGIWIIKGECAASDDESILSSSSSLEFMIADIESVALVRQLIPQPQANNIEIGISGLDEGFYKVFFRTVDDVLFWQNIFISPGTTNFPDFTLLDAACN